MEIAKEAGVVLGVSGKDINELYDTTAAIEKLGYKELVLDTTGATIKETFATTVQVRRACLAKEPDRPVKETRSGSRKNKAGSSGKERFTEKEESLFERLRGLRTEIAREEKVPPYIVFSDKTLTHMCIIKPRTRAEMLTVSGVGEFKFEKYGERFLACLRAED